MLRSWWLIWPAFLRAGSSPSGEDHEDAVFFHLADVGTGFVLSRQAHRARLKQ